MFDLIKLLRILTVVSPFPLICFILIKANLKREIRFKQFLMPFIALIFGTISMCIIDKIILFIIKIVDFLEKWIPFLDRINWNYWTVLVANISVGVIYFFIKVLYNFSVLCKVCINLTYLF